MSYSEGDDSSYLKNIIEIEQRFILDKLFTITEINNMSYVDFTMYVRMIQNKRAEELRQQQEQYVDPITGEHFVSADQDMSKFGRNIMNPGGI